MNDIYTTAINTQKATTQWMDILADNVALTVGEILEQITEQYLPCFQTPHVLDESTLRKKLKE